MKKKVLALIMVLALCLSLAPAALADSSVTYQGQAEKFVFAPGSDWSYCKSDDTYYYGKPVAPNGTTSDLIGSEGITLINGQVVEVLAEGIQSVPYNAVEEAWPAVEVVDGVLQVKEAGA